MIWRRREGYDIEGREWKEAGSRQDWYMDDGREEACIS
jgi:hypothetical protein